MFPMHEFNGTMPVVPPDIVSGHLEKVEDAIHEEEYEFAGHTSDNDSYLMMDDISKQQQEMCNQEARREALIHLERARTKPVAFAIRSNVNYDPTSDDHSPLQSFAIAFQAKDCLHIKEKYNDDWWIGRLVRGGADVGFIPSPMKLESLRLEHLNGFLHTNEDEQTQIDHEDTIKTSGGRLFGALNKDKRTKLLKGGKFVQHPAPYDVVPSIRPVILIGPSLKGFEVTDMMQKAIFNFLKEHFENRIIITRVTADISLAKQLIDQTNPANGGRGGGGGGVGGGVGVVRRQAGLMDRSSARMLMHMSEVTYEIERIFELARTMQLVVLDCDTINHPAQMAKTSLAPILVYLKVASPKVLQRLIKSRGRGQARQIDAQMNAAEKLIQLPSDAFDVVLDENQLEEACDHLAEFLENYWKAVHLPNQSEFLDMLEQEMKALSGGQQDNDVIPVTNHNAHPSNRQNYAHEQDQNYHHHHHQSVPPNHHYDNSIQNNQQFYTNMNNQAPIDHNNNNTYYNYGP